MRHSIKWTDLEGRNGLDKCLWTMEVFRLYPLRKMELMMMTHCVLLARSKDKTDKVRPRLCRIDDINDGQQQLG